MWLPAWTSRDLPIVVVDCAGTLVRFNRAATGVLSLEPPDIDRRLRTIDAQAIQDETRCRRDVRSGDRQFLLRVVPYTVADGETVGAVVTFTNVTVFRAKRRAGHPSGAIHASSWTDPLLCKTLASN